MDHENNQQNGQEINTHFFVYYASLFGTARSSWEVFVTECVDSSVILSTV